MAEETKFCICCGEDVPYSRRTRDGNEELTCVHCGFVVGTRRESSGAADCIITADDTASVRELLKGLLLNKGLAETVIAAENGQEFVGIFSQRLADHQPVDLVILDLEMPVMGGVSAARVMRAVEDKYHARRTPILFFSSQKCDDALKRQLGVFAPASYVNKGSSPHFDDLVERIDQLVTSLLHKRA
jgi:CheY-like chemotaxis protein